MFLFVLSSVTPPWNTGTSYEKCPSSINVFRDSPSFFEFIFRILTEQ
jgi:hypothetical protein